MAMKTNKGKDALFTEINITPLTDIFLVLLIIMMVVAPTFQSVDNTISVPEINSGISIENQNATVAITKDGNFYVNGKPVTPDIITKELEQLKPSLEKKEVVVKADKDTKSREIMSVMNAAQNAGYEKLIVAGEPLTKKAQDELKKADEKSVGTSYSSEAVDIPILPATEDLRPRVNIPTEG